MACFAAPMAEAIVTSVVSKVSKNNEHKGKFMSKIHWLARLLWIVTGISVAEHIYKGEVMFSFPFLAAIKTGNISEMMYEIVTEGVAIAAGATMLWVCIVLVHSAMTRKNEVVEK